MSFSGKIYNFNEKSDDETAKPEKMRTDGRITGIQTADSGAEGERQA